MPSTVLGKRTRSSAASDSPPAVSTRSKRRAQFVVLDNSENENPFVTSRSNKQNGEKMEIDSIAEKVLPSKRISRAGTVPAKHGAPESRVPLSPSKINTHFKAKKVVTVFEEKQPTPQTPRHRDAPSKVAVTPRHRVLVGGKPLTPRTPRTPTTPHAGAVAVYSEARQIFTRGNVPTALYGRESERAELQAQLNACCDGAKSGCIYVSGPPGTGKSAFVNDICQKIAAERNLKSAYVNCMSAKTAQDVHRKIFEEFQSEIDDADASTEDALKKLFFETSETYLVTLDEIDYLLDLDLELLYKIFEWSLHPSSSLVLIGIANALDFTDRFLPRLKARGLKPNLLPFLPYTAPQIASVITSKLKALLPEGATNKDHVPFIHPTAILFLSKKVAAQSGDLRKSFDICRRAIDLVEADTRDKHLQKATELTPSPTPSPTKTPLVENMNLSSPPVARSPLKPSTLTARNATVTASLAELNIETAPRASIAHVSRITAAVFSNGTTQRLQSLNLQQKAVLCALSALERHSKDNAATSAPEPSPFFSSTHPLPATPSSSKHPGGPTPTAPTVKTLFETYARLCRADNVLHPLTSTEFRDVVGSLETLSMVTSADAGARGGGSFAVDAGTPSRRGRKKGGFGGPVVDERRVASVVARSELAKALEGGVGAGVLRRILEGDVF